MRKYLIQAGYHHKKDANDMIDKQFYLSNISYTNSPTSTFSNIVLDTEATYTLFLKDFDNAILRNKLEGVINSALSDGIDVSLSNNIEVERQENGYMLGLTFYIQG